MKKYLSMLLIMFTLVVGVFTGCETVSKFNFSTDIEQIEIILGETSSTTEYIDDSVIFSVTKNEAQESDSIWISIQNESIATAKIVSENSTMINVLVKGLMPGTAKVVLYNNNNSQDFCEIAINVYQKIESINFVNDEDIYIGFGGSYQIKADTELNMEPIHSSKSELRYEMVTPYSGVEVNELTGFIDATNANQAGEFQIRVFSKNDPEINDTKTVKLVKQIEEETITITNVKGEEVVTLGQVNMAQLEIVKTGLQNTTDFENLQILCSEYDVDSLDVRITDYDNQIIQAEVKGTNIIRIQPTALGKANLTFTINLKNATKYLESVSFTLKINVIDLPNAININGDEVANLTFNTTSEKQITVYDRYNNVLGERIRFSVSPNSVSEEDSFLKVSFNDPASARYVTFLNEKGEIVPLEGNSFVVKSSENLYMRASGAGNTMHRLRVESVKAKEYNLNLSATLVIKVSTGLTNIIVEPEIYIEKGTTYELSFAVNPANADLTAYELGQTSDKITVSKTSQYSYAITGNEVTDEYLYFNYKNGGSAQTRIVVYVPLTKFALEVDNPFVNSNIGKKEYQADGVTLNKIYVQVGSEIDLKYIVNDGASISSSNYVIADSNKINCKNNIIEALRVGTSNLVVNVTGYEKDGSGQTTTLSASIIVEVYRAVSSISLSILNTVAYDYTSVGFYNMNKLGQVKLVANIYPQNATAQNIEWSISDASNNDSISGKLSTTTGASTIVTCGPLTQDEDTLTITATVKEFDRVYAENCTIQVHKAKLVESIVLNNVSNGNIFFDSRKGLNNEFNTFKVSASAYPTDALNKKLRFLYRDIDGVSTGSPIFKVDDSGLITPLRAGKAVLIVASEDSFSNATTATKYKQVYVTVQDGKSEATAFHIKTPSDLLAIGTDRDTMSYYYVLANDIDLNAITDGLPIGQSNNLAFTGCLSGQLVLEQAGTSQAIYRKNTIKNVRINKTIATRNINSQSEYCFGLFSKISSNIFIKGSEGYEGAPRIGTVKDLTVEIRQLNIDCSNIYDIPSDLTNVSVYVGGLAGRLQVDSGYNEFYNNAQENDTTYGLINNKVLINEFKYFVGVNDAYIGGLLGSNNANVEYTNKLGAVTGNDILIIDKKYYQIPGQASQREKDAYYYVGGLVGKNDINGLITSIFNKNFGNSNDYVALFENEGIDVTVNINNSFNGESYNDKLLSVNGVIGGLVGQNNGTIKNASTDNIVNGINSVGGLVGKNVDGQIIDCFSSSLVRANNNVGGLVGSNNGGNIENCYVQSYEDGVSTGEKATNVIGNSFVGGLVGSSQNGTISYSYSATYKDRTIGTVNSISQYEGDVIGNSFVGALVGDISGTNLSISYSNYVAKADGTIVGLIGKASDATIENVYCDVRATGISLVEEWTNTQINNSYIKYEYIKDEATVFDAIVYDENGLATELNETNSLNGECVDFSTEIWKTMGQYPVLRNELNGQFSLVQQPPQNIEIEINLYKVNNNSLMLFYYTSNDIESRMALANYNNFRISNLINTIITPVSGYVDRLMVTSSNEAVVKVTKDGQLVSVGLGNAQITVLSKLNRNIYATFDVYVSYPVLQFDLNLGSKEIVKNNQEYLQLKKGENYQILPFATANVEINGKTYEATLATNLYLEYVAYEINENGQEIVSEDYVDYFKIENANTTEHPTIQSLEYIKSQIINGIDATGDKTYKVYVKPYILIADTNEKVYLNEYEGDAENLGSDAKNKDFNINVILGATDFEFASEENSTVTAGTKVNIDTKLYTDDENDEVYIMVLNGSNKNIASGNSSSFSNQIFDISSTVGTLNDGVKNFSFEVELKDNYKFIKQEEVFTIVLTAKSNQAIKLNYFLTYQPETIQRIETRVYTYAEKDVFNDFAYNSEEEPSNSIIPGNLALLSINLFPYFADYDYIEVTNANITFEQVVKNDRASGYPYEKLSDKKYLYNGISLVDAYYENGVLKHGVNGEYYATMLLPTNTSSNNYTVNIAVYKNVNGTKTKVFNYDLVIECAYLPEVKLTYNGENNVANNEVYVPTGTESDLGVSLFEYQGDVKFDITKDDEVYPYASIVYKNGKYKLIVSDLANVGDVFKVKATIQKKIGKLIKTATDTLEIIVVDYVIQDIGFENVYNGVLSEVFGGSYILKISFENSKFFYNTNNQAIKEKIISDLNTISKSDYKTWYALKTTINGNDIPIGNYYKNSYIQVLTKSSKSKDLYVSGVNYEKNDSNQKRISAKIKISFDRVAKQWVFENSMIESLPRTNATMTSLLTKKYLSNGKIYNVFDKVFTVNLYLNTSRDNAFPIYSVTDLYEMQRGMNYILMNDLELDNFTPITTNFNSFNGNNHTIAINSYYDETELESRAGTKNIGLFAQIGEGVIVENLHLSINRRSLSIDAEGYSEVVFGMLAGVNNGNIYNCSVSFTQESYNSAIVSTVISGEQVEMPYDYQLTQNMAEEITSGNKLPFGAEGILVQITLTQIQENLVSSTMGVLVGQNNGNIANSRVESGVKFRGYGVMGGIAGDNSGVITSTYSKAIVYSYTSASESSKIGGFVGFNRGRISLSFAEGKNNLTNENTVPIEITGLNRIGGFVYENVGTISDCYSNLSVQSNAPTAGFVFTNSGDIKNTYSTSIIRKDSKQDAPYLGLNEFGVVNNTGEITNAYFLKGDYPYQNEQPATMVNSVAEFNMQNTFDSFAFDEKVDGTVTVNSEKGVWFIPTDSSSSSTDSLSSSLAFNGQDFILNKPTLVSPNIISRGYVDLLTTVSNDGQPQFIYTSLIGATLGSIVHPYVIYNAQEMNEYLLEPTSSNPETNNKHYILASDIDFADSAIMTKTYSLNFEGYFEGNAMKISNLKNSYQLNDISMDSSDKILSMGMFKTLNNATFKNLTIGLEEMYGSDCLSVGTLAGIITGSKVYNISLNGNSVVHAKNLGGGLAGLVENSVIKDIYSEISVNVGYRANIAKLFDEKVYLDNKNLENELKFTALKDMLSKVSYAGGVIGAVINSLVQSITITNGATVIGDMVGGAVGFVGQNAELNLIKVYVDDKMFIKGINMVGGLVSENRGTINKSFIQYENEKQELLDTSTSVGYFNNLVNNQYYRVGISDTNVITLKATAIGGLVGFNNNGTISNSYAKVNIYETNTFIAGGIVGRSLGGKIDTVYASSVIYISFSDTMNILNGSIANTQYFKYIGGIVGSLANNIVNKFTPVESDRIGSAQYPIYTLLSASNQLEIKNAISLVTFDSALISDYEKTKIGGIIGLLGSIQEEGEQTAIEPLQIDNNFENYFNNVVYNKAIPNIASQSDISFTIKDVAVITSLTDADTATSNMYEGTHKYGSAYEYLQMVSDGIRNEDIIHNVVNYEPWKRGNSYIEGVKSQIFISFSSKSFKFDSDTDKTPRLRNIDQTNASYDDYLNRATTIGNVSYSLSSIRDLRVLALLVNKSIIDNTGSKTNFVIQKDIDFYDLPFAGIGVSGHEFKDILEGNNHTISNIKFANKFDATGFINYGKGATIKNLAFRNVQFEINQTSSATVYGTIAKGENCVIYKVSVASCSDSSKAITIDKSGITFGLLAGQLYGTNAALNLSACYTILENIEIKSTDTNTKVSAFVADANIGQGLNIINCYTVVGSCSVEEVGETALNNCYGLIASVNPTNENKIVDSFAIVNSSGFSAWQTTDGPVVTKSYNDIDNSGFNYTSQSTYESASGNWENSYWENTTVWKLSEDNYPVHDYNLVKESSVADDSTGFDGKYTYTITTPTQLINIATKLQSGEIPNGGDGRIFTLGNNIDLNNEVFSQCFGSFSTPFKGVFDGNNNYISNFVLSANGTGESDISVGFFGRLDSATVKNVKFYNCKITNSQSLQASGKVYIGMVAGITVASTIENIHITLISPSIAELTDSNAINESINNVDYYVGGLVGYVESTKIKDCTFDGAFIITKNDEYSSKLRVGGIVGYVNPINVYITNNSVTIGNASSIADGIIGVHCGGIVGATTKAISNTQIINNAFYDNDLTEEPCGYGIIDDSNQQI